MGSWLLRLARRKGALPRMSRTEREALAAGTVWMDGELFSGRPDFRRALEEAYPRLSPEEQAFLDGPVEEVCRQVAPWRLARERELPPEVWDFLRREGFFGLNIPPAYGGRGFSALAQSAVFGKLASRSLALSAVVLIPNSVGPGELLLDYGTQAQKDRFLPRLAGGEEIPCFALTEPEAGSDAASLASRGEVFRGGDGQPMLRLDWDKRYITLAPVATLLGLAFRLRDPENLLGRGEEPGITLALVPTSLPGVEVGRRHDPMGVPFPNGPTRGRGVEVPMDAVIGGTEGVGRGWRMLMEALSAGRAISLPAQSVAGAKAASRIAGAYCAVRRQFGVPIGRFGGVEERLASMAGLTYLLEATRVYTCGAVDAGARPAVLSAAVKYQTTELLRDLVLDAMDVVAGAALCRGPRNLLADGYAAAPIGITVEGANILTRSLIVFGQGALRCHPYALAELTALEEGDAGKLRRALVGHGGAFLVNLARATFLSLTRGRLVRSPVPGPAARHFRRLAWASACFALLTDLALAAYGGRLKSEEKLTGRLADALAWMYAALATLRRFEAEGRLPEDRPLLDWALAESLSRVQAALAGVLRNFRAPVVGALLRGPVALWARLNPLSSPPPDRLGREVARALLTPGGQRDRLTAGVFLPRGEGEAMARLEEALRLTAESGPLLAKLRAAVKEERLPAGATPAEQVEAARKAELLSAVEADLLHRAAAARREAVRVDDFSLEEYLAAAGAPGAPAPVPA